MRLVAKEEKSGLVKGEKSGAAKNQNHNSLLTASRQLYLRPPPPPLPPPLDSVVVASCKRGLPNRRKKCGCLGVIKPTYSSSFGQESRVTVIEL